MPMRSCGMTTGEPANAGPLQGGTGFQPVVAVPRDIRRRRILIGAQRLRRGTSRLRSITFDLRSKRRSTAGTGCKPVPPRRYHPVMRISHVLALAAALSTSLAAGAEETSDLPKVKLERLFVL